MKPTFKAVDTCAAEFEAETPYYYSTWENESELRPSKQRKIMILGGGPNRIGQGIEFDACCCHAVMALREEGIELAFTTRRGIDELSRARQRAEALEAELDFSESLGGLVGISASHPPPIRSERPAWSSALRTSK